MRQTQQLWMLPLLPIGSYSRSTKASPISNATRFTNMPGSSYFDPTPRDEAPSCERLHKVLEMDLTGRLTVVGPSRIRFR